MDKENKVTSSETISYDLSAAPGVCNYTEKIFNDIKVSLDTISTQVKKISEDNYWKGSMYDKYVGDDYSNVVSVFEDYKSSFDKIVEDMRKTIQNQKATDEQIKSEEAAVLEGSGENISGDASVDTGINGDKTKNAVGPNDGVAVVGSAPTAEPTSETEPASEVGSTPTAEPTPAPRTAPAK